MSVVLPRVCQLFVKLKPYKISNKIIIFQRFYQNNTNKTSNNKNKSSYEPDRPNFKHMERLINNPQSKEAFDEYMKVTEEHLRRMNPNMPERWIKQELEDARKQLKIGLTKHKLPNLDFIKQKRKEDIEYLVNKPRERKEEDSDYENIHYFYTETIDFSKPTPVVFYKNQYFYFTVLGICSFGVIAYKLMYPTKKLL